MAYLDASATGTLGRLTSTAGGVAASYAATPVAPPSLSRVPALAAALQVLVSSTTATGTDVQVQVSASAAFATTVYDNTLTNQPDGLSTVNVTGLTDDTRYYWRVRAAETGTTSWTAWSPAWQFVIDADSGKAFWSCDLNVGPSLAMDRRAAWSVDENVNPGDTRVRTWPHQIDLNAGPATPLTAVGLGYVESGDVSTNTPTPHIWFLRPTSGREGDGIQVVGFGFGDLQSTYGGALEYRPDGTWEVLPVTSWQTFPATPDAYGPDRELNEELGTIDMQHQIVEFTVPIGSESPGFPVRMKTNGS